jgi:hypothetical protein
MGLDAEVIAIGQFSRSIISAMEYAPDLYASVPEGAKVIVHVFLACTSSASRELANAFGVDAMELGKHHLDPSAADIGKLTELFGERDVTQFKILRESSFDFYYAPNA